MLSHMTEISATAVSMIVAIAHMGAHCVDQVLEYFSRMAGERSVGRVSSPALLGERRNDP